MDVIQVMMDKHHYQKKPEGYEVGRIQNSLTATMLTVEQFANELTCGATARPGVLVGGRSAECWQCQQVFMVDIDEGATLEDTYERFMRAGITPVFAYESFSSTVENEKFRFVFVTSEVMTDGTMRDRLQAVLMKIARYADASCKNRDRLFFGTQKGVRYPCYNARLDAAHIIDLYWSADCIVYLPTAKQKKAGIAVAKEQMQLQKVCSIPVGNKCYDAIRSLDAEAHRDAIGGSFADTIITKDEYNGFLKHIDLGEYLGVPADGSKFSCILHSEKHPSASIYTVNDGTQIYHCFGCNAKYGIVSVTQRIAHCAKNRALEHINAVYGVVVVPTKWEQEQADLLSKEAAYVTSEAFQQEYHDLYLLIRTRRKDLRLILEAVRPYLNQNRMINGNPYFYLSYTDLMRICNKKSKQAVVQSITLFVLVGLMKKVDPHMLPTDMQLKASEACGRYASGKVTNFYQMPVYSKELFVECDERAKQLRKKNITIKGLSREYILRTFGVEEADRVFPQYRTENRNENYFNLSDEKTRKLGQWVMEQIRSKGFVKEKDIKDSGYWDDIQWHRAGNEILRQHHLKKLRATKQIKQRLAINSNGYPFIIVKDDFSPKEQEGEGEYEAKEIH